MVKDRSREKWLQREERRKAKVIVPAEVHEMIKPSPSRTAVNQFDEFRRIIGEANERMARDLKLIGDDAVTVWGDASDAEPDLNKVAFGDPMLEKILSANGLTHGHGLRSGELVVLGGGRRVGKSFLGKTADFMIYDEAAAFTPPPVKTPEQLEVERAHRENRRLEEELSELFTSQLVAEREQLGYGGW